MLQHVITSLRRKELLTPAFYIFILLIALSLIVILAQFFHESLKTEMAGQFNQQQLILAREVAINIESFIDHAYKDLLVISRIPQVHTMGQNSSSRPIVDTIALNMRNEVLDTIRVLNDRGIVVYDSAATGREGANLFDTPFFQRARYLPRNEKQITDLQPHPDRRNGSQQFIIATPIYNQPPGALSPQFSGVVLAVLSLEGITRKFIEPIKSGTRGYAWMMDSDGTLLFHPSQPQMVGKNLYQADKSCFQCHQSFDTEKRMIESSDAAFGSYDALGIENKLASYYKVPIARKSWFVVVTAPYTDVIALMQKSSLFYTLLIVSIMAAAVAISGTMIVSNKKKVMLEEKAKNLDDLQRLERELEIQKDYLETIIENTKTNLMVVDKDLVVRTLNSAQARTFGRSKEDILGRSLLSLFPTDFHPHEGIPIESFLANSLAGRSFEIKDYALTSLRETPLYLTMYFNPLLIDGKTPGILITSNDVTQRVQLEEALKQYTVELEDKVDRETATAKKLEQQVMHSEKLAALGRLAAGVAHEIGNPLTSISTFAQMLREMATDEFSQKSLDVINNHIHRITDIVRRMSTFSRADSLNIKDVQINETLRSTLDLMRLDKRMKDTIDIVESLDPAVPPIRIDEGQISQVFINIIINALDAMSEGGTLTITSRSDQDERGGAYVLISFADTGSGIPPENLEKIFDPFFTTKEAGKGTGLGLSLSYNIIKRFKGDIKVESKAGAGTTFTIILPIEQPQREGDRRNGQAEHTDR